MVILSDTLFNRLKQVAKQIANIRLMRIAIGRHFWVKERDYDE